MRARRHVHVLNLLSNRRIPNRCRIRYLLLVQAQRPCDGGFGRYTVEVFEALLSVVGT